LEALRALEARRMPDVQRVGVDVVVDALRHADLTVEELAKEGFGDFLLRDRRRGHQDHPLLHVAIAAPADGVTAPSACGAATARCSRTASFRGRLRNVP